MQAAGTSHSQQLLWVNRNKPPLNISNQLLSRIESTSLQSLPRMNKFKENEFLCIKPKESDLPFTILVEKGANGEVFAYIDRNKLEGIETSKEEARSLSRFKAVEDVIKIIFNSKQNHPECILVKKLKPNLTGLADEEIPPFMNHFKNEILRTSLFKGCSGVAQIESWGTYTGSHKKNVQYKIVFFEPCYECDLFEFLNDRLPFIRASKSPKEFLRFIQSICQSLVEGIANIHAKKILHMDLKKENIFLERVFEERMDSAEDEDTNFRYISHIGDFGNSKTVFALNENDRDVTALDYCSIKRWELLKDNLRPISEVDFDDEIWAIGCILHELVYGDYPQFNRLLSQISCLSETKAQCLDEEHLNKKEKLDEEALSVATELKKNHKNPFPVRDSFDHLFWQIFHPDKARPLTASEIAMRLPQIFKYQIESAN